MFRIASERELQCLLQAQSRECVIPAEVETPEERIRVMSDQVRAAMLETACQYIFQKFRDHELRLSVQDMTGQQWACSCDPASPSKYCKDCREHCLNFANGCLTVLERDFVQFTHGEHATLLENRPGVQFLLAGITLGLLYESVPEKHGVDELVLTSLVIMTDVRVWCEAMRVFGPAPRSSDLPTTRVKRVQTLASTHDHPRSQSVHQAAAAVRSRVQLTSGMQGASSAPDVSTVPFGTTPPAAAPVPIMAASSDTDINYGHTVSCSVCSKAFINDDIVQECDCGTVSICYFERVNDEPTDIQGSRTRSLSQSVIDRNLNAHLRSLTF